MERDVHCYPLIDVMKFAMAIFVIALHARPLADYNAWGNFFVVDVLTRIAVPYFFIAAGFFLFQNMSSHVVDAEKVRKYVLRILRLYVIWCLVYSPLILHAAYEDPKGWLHGAALQIQLFFVHAPMYHLWFLPALALAAAACWFLLRKGLSYGFIVGLSAALYVIPLLGTSYYGIFASAIAGQDAVFAVLKLLRQIFRLPVNGLTVGLLFVSGGGLIAITNKRFNPMKMLGMASFFLIACTIEAFSLKASDVGAGYGLYIFLVPLSFAVFCWSKDASLRPAYARLCTTLRKLSMMIYFVHPWFLFLLNAADKKLMPLDSLERFLLAVFLSVATAALWLHFRPRYPVLQKLG